MTTFGGNGDGEEMIRHDMHDEGDPRLQALFGALAAPDAIDPDVAARHVAMAAAEAAGAAPVATAGGAPWHRRLAARAAGVGLTVKILAGAAAAVAATGGAAAWGILPGPVQSFVADTAAHVGLHFPNPRLATTTTTAPTTVTTAAGATTTTTIDEGDEAGTTVPPVVGAAVWETTTCSGDAVAVHYTVTEAGELQLVEITGDATDVDVDVDDDRIRVRFGAVRIDIRSDDRVAVDEDRRCATPSTVPSGGGDHDDDDDDDDDGGDDGGDDDDGDDGGDHPTVGAYLWSNTACDGTPISVSYTVADDGTLVLDSISGETDGIDEDDDRIRVRFEDGVEVDIRVVGEALVVTADRDCDAEAEDDADDADDESDSDD